MFTQAVRWSGALENEVVAAITRKAHAMWMGAGAQSMQRFRITDGPHTGQHMVVIRFNTRADWEKAREALSHERSNLLKEAEAAGLKNEETLLLDEVVDQPR